MAENSPQTHVLLIGVDYYFPGQLAGGTHYPSLRGCVRDVGHMEEFLKGAGIHPDSFLKLTATNTGVAGQKQPPEPADTWPTYKNMIAAFERIIAVVRRSDRVYVHYAGHGGRAATIVPEKKGAHGIDEALVPTDVHDPNAQYLRDVELAVLFKRLVDKGVRLSVVLDSCHSGGAVRGVGDVAVRSIDTVDETARPMESLVASAQQLAGTWPAGELRTVKGGGGWLPEPEGYVLLAACRPSEYAYEFAFNGKERNGAVTYWLLDTLRAHGPGLSFSTLHGRIVAKVHTQFVRQTPQLQGEGQFPFLGDRIENIEASVPILEVGLPGDRLKLAAGQVFGFSLDAEFAVYPIGTTNFQDKAKRIAIVTVVDVGATDALAEITEKLQDHQIEAGCPAIVINPGTTRLAQSIGFVAPTDFPSGAEGTKAEVAIQAVRNALAGSKWAADAGESHAIEIQVGLKLTDGTLCYELWDSTGKPIPNLRPDIEAGVPELAGQIVRRLEHLARYRAVEQLECYEGTSPLAGKLVVELAGVLERYVRGERPNPRPFSESGATPALEIGHWTFLRIRNLSAQKLNVAVLDLQPDWGISQIYPYALSDFVELEPGKELPLIPLQAELPQDYVEGRDVIKVMASIGPANFRMLCLPALDAPVMRSTGKSPEQRRSATPGRSNPLEALFAALTADAPRTRTLKAITDPTTEWTTASVELRVRRPEP
jgi:hypothetical protein